MSCMYHRLKSDVVHLSFDGIVLVDNINILIKSCSVSITHVDTACNINVGFVDKCINAT